MLLEYYSIMFHFSPGRTYHLLKQFAQYNFQLNEAVLQYEGPSRMVWPLVLFMNDNCVMWKRVGGEEGAQGKK